MDAALDATVAILAAVSVFVDLCSNCLLDIDTILLSLFSISLVVSRAVFFGLHIWIMTSEHEYHARFGLSLAQSGFALEIALLVIGGIYSINNSYNTNTNGAWMVKNLDSEQVENENNPNPKVKAVISKNFRNLKIYVNNKKIPFELEQSMKQNTQTAPEINISRNNQGEISLFGQTASENSFYCGNIDNKDPCKTPFTLKIYLETLSENSVRVKADLYKYYTGVDKKIKLDEEKPSMTLFVGEEIEFDKEKSNIITLLFEKKNNNALVTVKVSDNEHGSVKVDDNEHGSVEFPLSEDKFDLKSSKPRTLADFRFKTWSRSANLGQKKKLDSSELTFRKWKRY
jgi:hypothetical protein